MKYIKTYENAIKIGDYVICMSLGGTIVKYAYIDEPFNRIGKIHSLKEYRQYDKEYFMVMYGDGDQNYIHYAKESEIIYRSSNLEDVILYLNAMKYNL
jgi:hypothetical protein